MNRVFLSLGSNVGDRLAQLRRAREAIARQVRVLAASSIYETEPWGYTEQPGFLNQVLMGETDLGPGMLLDFVKFLEAELGRTPTFRYGPREIDIDILFYGNLVMETPQLVIPHPRLHERAFVLVPLEEIAPGLRHPVLGLTVADLVARVDTRGVQRLKAA